MKRITRLLALACLAALAGGCEIVSNDDNGAALASASGAAAANSSPKKSSSLVGTWLLKEKSGTGSWYVIFAADGTWVIKDTPSAARNRVYGTYTVSGNKFSGPMTNPGVGTGQISGTFSGSSMDFTFVEHWHNPHKTVLYTGTKK